MQNRANIYDNRLMKEIKSDIGGLQSGLQMYCLCFIRDFPFGRVGDDAVGSDEASIVG